MCNRGKVIFRKVRKSVPMELKDTRKENASSALYALSHSGTSPHTRPTLRADKSCFFL